MTDTNEKYAGMDIEQLRSMAEGQGWLDSLAAEAREKKVYALLAEGAEIEEIEPASGEEDEGDGESD